jgi:hypothetical protein
MVKRGSLSRKRNLHAALRRAVENVGSRRTEEILKEVSAVASGDDVLTIVCNAGIHVLGARYRRGEVFIASKGSLDFSNAKSIKAEYQKILLRTAHRLKARPWRQVYIVPFGPTTLAMQIKLLVYRITGVESIDVAHIGGNARADIEIDLRRIAERQA